MLRPKRYAISQNFFPVAEMIYDRYKDSVSGRYKVFLIKRYYKTMNMSLRHVAKHAAHLLRHDGYVGCAGRTF